MVGNDQVYEVINQLYDTVIDSSKWVETLDLVKDAIGAEGIILFDLINVPNKGDTLIAPLMTSNFNPKNVEKYLETFGEYEAEDQIRFAKLSDRGKAIELVGVSDLYEHGDLERRPNVQYLREHGVAYRAGAILNKDSWQIDRFSMQFATDDEPLNAERLALAGQILPHMSKALRLARPCGISSEGLVSIQQFDNLDLGICLISPQGYPIYRNPEFQHIDEQYGLFRINPDGHLLPVNNRLKAYIGDYFSGLSLHGRFGAQPRRESLSLHFDKDNSTIFIEAGPVSNHKEFGILPAGTQLLQILDINRARNKNSNALNRYFPLSKTECEISALIIDGHSNHEIAEIRGRAVDTVNSQVKTIFKKTYTSSRVELAQLSYALDKSFIPPQNAAIRAV